ncbi:MAG: hypothetical protein U0793_21210 [Gemmataceae bacterium]
MSKRIRAACLALALGWIGGQQPRSEARPPDLPQNPQVNCPEGRVIEEGAVPAVVVEVAQAVGDAPAVPDLTWLDALLPHLVTKAAQDAVTPQPAASVETARSPSNREVQLDRYRQAQRILGLGIAYEQRGLFSKARTCYQETHLLSPETRYGRQAMERLTALEQRSRERDGSEEADEPATSNDVRERNHENMRRQTAPLGTVPLESY